MPRRGRDRHDGEAAAPVRAFWSGTITFGLVNIPVDLFAAVRGRRKSMHMVDARGRPLGRRYVCSKDGKPLSPQDIVRGYETDGGDWVVVTDAELDPDTFKPESDRLAEERAKVGRPVTRVKLPGHSHISELYAVNTADESLSGPVLKFVQEHSR